MTITDLNKLAQQIVLTNNYMTIASTDLNGNPWASVVAYAFDNKYNFYFISMKTSKHAQQITQNNKIVVVIFDSRQLLMDGVGLQIEGICNKVNFRELPKAIKTYFGRRYPFGSYFKEIKKFLINLIKIHQYEMYKFIPIQVWMNDPNAKIDRRIKVSLKK